MEVNTINPDQTASFGAVWSGSILNVIRPNKKIIVFRVTGLKILGRVGTHFFLIIFFREKKIKIAFQNA